MENWEWEDLHKIISKLSTEDWGITMENRQWQELYGHYRVMNKMYKVPDTYFDLMEIVFNLHMWIEESDEILQYDIIFQVKEKKEKETREEKERKVRLVNKFLNVVGLRVEVDECDGYGDYELNEYEDANLIFKYKNNVIKVFKCAIKLNL